MPYIDYTLTTEIDLTKEQISTGFPRQVTPTLELGKDMRTWNKKKLNKKHYVVVIDMQNNLKSAAVSFLINKPVHGMDRTSVREYPAHLAYDFKYKISKEKWY